MTSDDDRTRPHLVRADRAMHDRPLILGGLIIGSVWAIVDAVSR